MEILPGVEIVDLALRYKNYLIICDVQLGYEDAVAATGVLLPSVNLSSIIERLDRIFAKVSVGTVVVNGDIKHEFGRISTQEWYETLAFFDYLAKRVKNIILVKGNHDIVLGPLAEKRQIKVHEYFQIDDITVLHGHKIIPNLTKIVVIGHEHPAVSFREKPYEKYKCFLKGKWHDKTLIAMPSFTFLTEGSDVTKEHALSPFLQDVHLDTFEVYVVEDTVYYFGTMRKLQGL